MLKVKKILIKNYKSIKNGAEFKLNNWNILLGQNEVGKSNIINSIKNIWNYFDSKNKKNSNFYSENSNFFLGKTNENPIILKMYFKADVEELKNIENNLVDIVADELKLPIKCKNMLTGIYNLNEEFYLNFSIQPNNEIKIESNLIKINEKNVDLNDFINCAIEERKLDVNVSTFHWNLYDEFIDLNFNIQKYYFATIFNYVKDYNQIARQHISYIQYKNGTNLNNNTNIANFLKQKIDNQFISKFNSSKCESLEEYFIQEFNLKNQIYLTSIEIENNKLTKSYIIDEIKKLIFTNHFTKDLFIWKWLLNFDCILWEYSEDFLLKSNYKLTEYKSIDDISSMPLRNVLSILFSRNKIKDYEKWINLLNEDNNKRYYSQLISDIINTLLKKSWYIFEDQNYNIDVQIQDNLSIKIQIQQLKKKSELTRYLFNNFSNRSDGFKRFASYVLCLNTDINYKNKLILIDELEIHLHLDAFINLLKYIDEISNSKEHNYTFVVSTLSPFVFNKSFTNLSYFLVSKKNNLSSRIEEIQFNSFLDYPNIVGFNILDFLIKPDFLILVEGDTDKEFWNYILQNELGIKNYLIWSSRGASSILKDLNIFEEKIKQAGLELKNVHAIYDHDEEGIKQFEKMKKEFKGINIHYIDEFSTQNKYNIENFVLEDIYNRNLMLKLLESIDYLVSDEEKNNFIKNYDTIKNYSFYKKHGLKVKILSLIKNENSKDKFQIDKEKIKNILI